MKVPHGKHAYRCRFQGADAGPAWDSIVYGPGSYESYVWSMQQPFLLEEARALASVSPYLYYLDFACGTGRVLAALSPCAGTVTGVDVSPAMLRQAAEKVPAARLIEGDVTRTPNILEGQYDLITAFRFFLNTEPDVRLAVMRALAMVLRDSDSRLIFNVHGNALSSRGLSALLARRGGADEHKIRAPWAAWRMVVRSGLEIVDWRGYGLCPRFAHSGALRRLATRLDNLALHSRYLRSVCRDLVFVCRRSGEGV